MPKVKEKGNWSNDKFTKMVQEYGDKILDISEKVEKDLKTMLENSEEIKFFSNSTDLPENFSKKKLKNSIDAKKVLNSTFLSILSSDIGITYDNSYSVDALGLLPEQSQRNDIIVSVDESNVNKEQQLLNEIGFGDIDTALLKEYDTYIIDQLKQKRKDHQGKYKNLLKDVGKTFIQFLLTGPGTFQFYDSFTRTLNLLKAKNIKLEPEYLEKIKVLYNNDTRFRNLDTAIWKAFENSRSRFNNLEDYFENLVDKIDTSLQNSNGPNLT